MNAQSILQKARLAVVESGLTYEKLGQKMGWPKESARQSSFQFLHSTNPSVAMLIRFAKAMEIDVRNLFED